ncbi:ROK family transcriptional regulator [Lactonifactor longoviformis]|uniref:Sugar kinase of the NBD/HSP70 family, may contain an N-terminal HTH domain n=1 Tax=Lactonifactor longoviformis DSM 17459 TaxID=1122155 RepID=A0A1M4WJK7_9CLOT|nr:ROK family transcriptional regulator [Lactonifactor longoviformis]POP30570.1 ROK family transcriptional regulator [Lactonifactor longoviformis]SHE81396.1 Sugar kinase of the NBD/HSP70 family, may contain an N-terminal HTH domain [Lactonifactor longoviformis DSM 17459]
MKVDSSVELKKVHAKEIINYLKRNKSCTKKVMAEDLSLSFATVSNICNEMREKGYLEETALDDTKVVGRTPKGISLNYNNLMSLCFDLTRFGVIRVAVADYSTRVVYDDRFDYSHKSSIQEVIQTCGSIYREQVLKRFSEDQIVGVGVAVPGIFEKKTHNIVSSEIELFNNQPMKEMLSQTLGKTVYIDNESNLCVMSEYMRENLYRNQENIVYLFADEGLGIGVVANGKLICGSGGYAPEICHMPIGNMQMQCHLCSSMGCVESDLRIMGYVEKYNLYSRKQIASFEEFLELWGKKEETAVQVLEENAAILGRLLSILNNIFNPDCIYIGGETVGLIREVIEKSMEQVTSRLLVQGNVLPEIKMDADCSATVLCGAAEMVFSQWMPL